MCRFVISWKIIDLDPNKYFNRCSLLDSLFELSWLMIENRKISLQNDQFSNNKIFSDLKKVWNCIFEHNFGKKNHCVTKKFIKAKSTPTLLYTYSLTNVWRNTRRRTLIQINSQFHQLTYYNTSTIQFCVYLKWMNSFKSSKHRTMGQRTMAILNSLFNLIFVYRSFRSHNIEIP